MEVNLALVWTPASVAAAAIGGLGMGLFVVGTVSASPRYQSAAATSAEIGGLVVLLAIVVGAVFYGGQAVATWADSDPNWPRVISRFGLWVLYGLCLGAGTWFRLHRAHVARRRRLIERARAEIGSR